MTTPGPSPAIPAETTPMTPKFRCQAVDKILIATGVSVVTVSIVIVIGVLYYKLNIRGARSGGSSKTMSWYVLYNIID